MARGWQFPPWNVPTARLPAHGLPAVHRGAPELTPAPTPSLHRPLTSPAVRPVLRPETPSAGWAPRRASPAYVSSPSSRPAAPTPVWQPHWVSGRHPRLSRCQTEVLALPCGPVPLLVRGSSAPLEALGFPTSLSLSSPAGASFLPGPLLPAGLCPDSYSRLLTRLSASVLPSSVQKPKRAC